VCEGWSSGGGQWACQSPHPYSQGMAELRETPKADRPGPRQHARVLALSIHAHVVGGGSWEIECLCYVQFVRGVDIVARNHNTKKQQLGGSKDGKQALHFQFGGMLALLLLPLLAAGVVHATLDCRDKTVCTSIQNCTRQAACGLQLPRVPEVQWVGCLPQNACRRK
jgi:hypothetical protein